MKKLNIAYIAIVMGVLFYPIMFGLKSPVYGFIWAGLFFIVLTIFAFMKEPRDLI